MLFTTDSLACIQEQVLVSKNSTETQQNNLAARVTQNQVDANRNALQVFPAETTWTVYRRASHRGFDQFAPRRVLGSINSTWRKSLTVNATFKGRIPIQLISAEVVVHTKMPRKFMGA